MIFLPRTNGVGRRWRFSFRSKIARAAGVNSMPDVWCARHSPKHSLNWLCQSDNAIPTAAMIAAPGRDRLVARICAVAGATAPYPRYADEWRLHWPGTLSVLAWPCWSHWAIFRTRMNGQLGSSCGKRTGAARREPRPQVFGKTMSRAGTRANGGAKNTLMIGRGMVYLPSSTYKSVAG